MYWYTYLQVLCNALWYTTNHHSVINDASKHKKEVLSFPMAFDDYDGYNNIKRKKLKSMPLTATELESHSEALYSLLMKPVVSSSSAWKKAAEEIKQLAACLAAYSSYLKAQKEKIQQYHNSDHPARTIDKLATVEHREKCTFGVKKVYSILDEVIISSEEKKPVYFDEFEHLESPFTSNQERSRFFEHLQVSVPIDIVHYSPGGTSLSVHCIFKVPEHRSIPEMMTEAARFLQKCRPNLQEFHTRAQRRLFKEKLKNVASVLPTVSDLIYKELTLDATVAAHPVTQERLRLIFLGNTGLVRDLRSLNPGRPSGHFDVFFEALAGQIDNLSAADDRRHGVAHLSEYISLQEMVTKAKDACPEGTPVPSKSLVRLQFAPRNPYTRIAQNFTSRLNVQYKIQRRQLRVSHPDEHYCNAQFRYLKERAVQQHETVMLFFCDDKAKVPFGDPNHLISSGVRGKKSIVPSTSTLSALDHDMTRASLTPSVILQCKVPSDVDKSFVRGQVTTVVNDSTFQASSPFRHNAVLGKMISQQENYPPVLIKFTDGGTDQRNNLESVKCATICLFKVLNLDMVILCRCAPGHSYVNPAERVMSILNLGLQNVALQRKATDDDSEAQFKRCNSMADLRELAKKKPQLKNTWLESVESVQSLVRNRFLRLKLKEDPFAALDPILDEGIDELRQQLQQLFPDLDLEKLTKAGASKAASYVAWTAKHCRSRHYSYQVRKCDDLSCCSAPSLSRDQLQWLPDPVLNADGDHFRPYQEVKHMDTDENDRPSLKAKVRVAKRQKGRDNAGIVFISLPLKSQFGWGYWTPDLYDCGICGSVMNSQGMLTPSWHLNPPLGFLGAGALR